MKKIKIKDSSITHNPSLSLKQIPSFFEWDKNCISKYTFITDNELNQVENNSIAWLVEPYEIYQNSYEFIINNHDKFKYILTYDKSLNYNNVLFYPFGGCWINDEDCRIYDKTKDISFIHSGKNISSGHKLRHEVIKKCHGFDLYGRDYKNITDKITSLKDYRYQIVIENTKVDDFFTEKIIDCFQTGTIPIYWGSKNIVNYFDINGIIQFDDIETLKDIILFANKELYDSKIESIKNNFDISKKYKTPEDWLYKNYPFIFDDK